MNVLLIERTQRFRKKQLCPSPDESLHGSGGKKQKTSREGHDNRGRSGSVCVPARSGLISWLFSLCSFGFRGCGSLTLLDFDSVLQARPTKCAFGNEAIAEIGSDAFARFVAPKTGAGFVVGSNLYVHGWSLWLAVRSDGKVRSSGKGPCVVKMCSCSWAACFQESWSARQFPTSHPIYGAVAAAPYVQMSDRKHNVVCSNGSR